MTADVGTPPAGPGLLATTVAALQGSGRLVATDWDAETFDVHPREEGGLPIAGVILHTSNSVAFYAVWDDTVPAPARAAVAEWSVRANTDLTTSAVEFSLDTGILAIRSVVHLGSVTVGTPGVDVPEEATAISRTAYAALLQESVMDVEAAYQRYRPQVADLLAGT
ncbi:MAG: hypothetical protein BGO26_11700 [Actinobacteria bacterium 69-20]|jgi:predicted RNA methylase|nr:hypothetical protein [Actinomycetota bacterium]OJV26578.1 MAG: hypothetical protein BGO26_11700 [Actinobacteria bacterium 69-20]